MPPTLSITPDSSGSSSSTYALHIPPRLLVLPPAALGLGLVIGMSRGGSRARLRFLAENAHRLPTTIQGWYFYTKTRNYRILFGAARQGARDGLLLGAATAGYVLVEEGAGRVRRAVRDGQSGVVAGGGEAGKWKGKGREQLGVERGTEAAQMAGERVDWERAPVGQNAGDGEGAADGEVDLAAAVATAAPHTSTSEGWEWLDGGVAGGVMGLVVGLLYRFPGAMILRTSTLGLILGASEGGLRIAQAKIGALKAGEDARRALEAPPPPRSDEEGAAASDATGGAEGMDLHAREEGKTGQASTKDLRGKVPLLALSKPGNVDGGVSTSSRI